MKYLSVCSGVEAASVAWHDLGWQPVAFSEIEPFPSAVLAHRFPNVPNVGDMTKYKEWNLNESIDLLVGGTPCQSFSVAGLRKGLEDPRGNLMLTYCGILDHFRPKWFVWENVPGVLSSNGGRDFGSFLGALGELGYGFSYRVLDAQYFGVPQRRRRVFVVGHLGDWRHTTKVLFERESLQRDSKTSARTQSRATKSAEGRSPDGSHTIGRQPMNGGNGTGYTEGGPMYTLNATGVHGVAVDVYNQSIDGNVTATLTQACGGTNTSGPKLMQNMVVRRLTPVECERLQGFPDNHTNIPWRKKEESPDGPRYKAMGNSMAVPVMHWIGKRIDEVEKTL